MPVEGQTLVLKNIRQFGGGFVNHVNKSMGKVEKLLGKRIKANMRLKDHSLKDLADLGHPYANRDPKSVHEPNYQVHTQSGELLKSFISGTVKVSIKRSVLKGGVYAGVDEGKAEHALHIIYGTSKMVPRDFVVNSLLEIKEDAKALIKSQLKNGVLQFNPRFPS